jgi:hypothetical protein
VDAARARVEGVLDELLDDRRGPLHDLPGLDLVDEVVGQALDESQGFSSKPTV